LFLPQADGCTPVAGRQAQRLWVLLSGLHIIEVSARPDFHNSTFWEYPFNARNTGDVDG
jgi:hypothetical protein